jgi:hypothetical protein
LISLGDEDTLNKEQQMRRYDTVGFSTKIPSSVYRLVTICPKRGDVVATHAAMRERDFEKFNTDLIFYCSSCGSDHLVTRDRVWLEGENSEVQARK